MKLPIYFLSCPYSESLIVFINSLIFHHSHISHAFRFVFIPFSCVQLNRLTFNPHVQNKMSFLPRKMLRSHLTILFHFWVSKWPNHLFYNPLCYSQPYICFIQNIEMFVSILIFNSSIIIIHWRVTCNYHQRNELMDCYFHKDEFVLSDIHSSAFILKYIHHTSHAMIFYK